MVGVAEWDCAIFASHVEKFWLKPSSFGISVCRRLGQLRGARTEKTMILSTSSEFLLELGELLAGETAACDFFATMLACV